MHIYIYYIYIHLTIVKTPSPRATHPARIRVQIALFNLWTDPLLLKLFLLLEPSLKILPARKQRRFHWSWRSKRQSGSPKKGINKIPHTQRIHVLYIDHHLPSKSTKCRCIYTVHGLSGLQVICTAYLTLKCWFYDFHHPSCGSQIAEKKPEISELGFFAIAGIWRQFVFPALKKNNPHIVTVGGIY